MAWSVVAALAAALPAQARTSCTGDLNGNGVVEGADLAILLGEWGECVGCIADLNDDGMVDGADLAILLGGWGDCGGEAFCGDVGAGDCCVPNDTPHCKDAPCCEIVCVSDAFCCATAWDSLCAAAAVELCAGCGGTGFCGDAASGNCCEANGTPFCSDANCCEAVCAVDPFCCETSWDSICAGEAENLCVSCVDACGDPLAGSCCEANETPFCNEAACCEEVCAADPFCCGVNWDGLCAESAVGLCANCGGSGFCGDPGSNDCCADSLGTPFCSDITCCEEVCASDPFCCDTDWDQLCADAALELCTLCGGAGFCGDPGSGSCCESNGTPFCSDAQCCESVCAVDPFCCETSWDSICADEAAKACGACGG